LNSLLARYLFQYFHPRLEIKNANVCLLYYLIPTKIHLTHVVCHTSITSILLLFTSCLCRTTGPYLTPILVTEFTMREVRGFASLATYYLKHGTLLNTYLAHCLPLMEGLIPFSASLKYYIMTHRLTHPSSDLAWHIFGETASLLETPALFTVELKNLPYHNCTLLP